MDNNYILLVVGVSLVHFFKFVPSLGSVPGSPEWMSGLETRSGESWKGRDGEKAQGKRTCKIKHI